MDRLIAADLLIETIQRAYRDDVAVVVIMGSTIYQDTHSKSDLDLYFVVNTPRGHDLAMTFIIDGIGYDYWAISWERLTRIANHEERITSILTEGQVIYVGSDQDRQRFEALKAHALDVSDKHAFVRKARTVFDRVYRLQFWQSQAQDLTQVRAYGMDLLFALTHALALHNRETVKRGRGKLKGELLAMAGVVIAVANRVRVVHVRGVSSRSNPWFVEWHKHRGLWRYFSKFEARERGVATRALVLAAIWARFPFAVASALWRSGAGSQR